MINKQSSNEYMSGNLILLKKIESNCKRERMAKLISRK